MSASILVLNAGSSSVKFQLFDLAAGERLKRRLKGQIEGIGSHPHLVAKDQGGQSLVEERLPAETVPDVPAALDRVLAWLGQQLGGRLPVAVGHRVVHGGVDYAEPVLVDEGVLQRLERLVPLAPLHQPNNLAAIRAVMRRCPGLPQVACFDTAFHRGHTDVTERYAIPEALHREGVRRYGFHGLSYEYIASVLPQQAPEIAAGRVVVAHLGSGCSLCALKGGRSVDTTMGFTALDGLPMGTRPGRIDPGVLLYLLTAKGWDVERLQHFLYHDCGLKGLSGQSNDMRDLLVSDTAAARLAVSYFIYRTAQEVLALAGTLRGLDALVFTAGIGENAPEIRSRLCRELAWLGLELDERANDRGGPRISRPHSKVSAWVIPTDEERMIALHTHQLCAALASH